MRFEDKTYRNVFLEIGKNEAEIEERVQNTFNEIFYGKNRFFYMNDEETMVNNDIRD